MTKIVLALIFVAGCAPAPPRSPTPPPPVSAVDATPAAPPPTAMTAELPTRTGNVEIAVNGTSDVSRRVCREIARISVLQVVVPDPDCRAAALPAITTGHGVLFVEEFPFELALTLAHEAPGSAAGAIRQLTWFESLAECERYKDDAERKTTRELEAARTAIVDALDKEAAREDAKAREACAAHRSDDCDVAREIAKQLRAKADTERARSIEPAHVGDCRN